MNGEVAACVEGENDTRRKWWSYHCLDYFGHGGLLDD